jgi:hypothetical protein
LVTVNTANGSTSSVVTNVFDYRVEA